MKKMRNIHETTPLRGPQGPKYRIKYKEPIFNAPVEANPNRESMGVNEMMVRLPLWATLFDRLSKLGKKWENEFKNNKNGLPF